MLPCVGKQLHRNTLDALSRADASGLTERMCRTPAETELDIDIGQGTTVADPRSVGYGCRSDRQAGIIPTLATPCVLEDTSWIKAGRAYRVRGAYTTPERPRRRGLGAKHKLEYIEYDAHWYGDGTDDSDATVPGCGAGYPQD